MRRLFALFVAFFVLASLASAQSEGGILNAIKGLFRTILSMLGMGVSTPKETTTTQPLCSPPYIQVGAGCCLDENENGICDGDEESTATTVEETSSTIVTSTLAATTTESTSTTERPTTTTIRIRCARNLDCGVAREDKVCYKGDIYLKKVTPICRNSGTAAAECIEKTAIGEYPVEDCLHECSEGRCVS